MFIRRKEYEELHEELKERFNLATKEIEKLKVITQKNCKHVFESKNSYYNNYVPFPFLCIIECSICSHSEYFSPKEVNELKEQEAIK